MCGFLSTFGSAFYTVFNPQIRIIPVAAYAIVNIPTAVIYTHGLTVYTLAMCTIK